ncbi:hypothetical protein Rs2_46632 [Raphanus sativus]|nr:hypothetical protein Rs2_46632 [Raphanus sativus]
MEHIQSYSFQQCTRSGLQVRISTYRYNSIHLGNQKLEKRSDAEPPSCLVTHMLEIHSKRWCKWKRTSYSKFEKTIPYALLLQVAGLKEYIGANPAFKYEASSSVVQSKLSDIPSGEYVDEEIEEQVKNHE